MDTHFYNQIANSTAHTNCRKDKRDLLLKHPEYLKDLFFIATLLNDKNHHKAVWIIEMLAETHIELLLPFIDQICDAAPKYKHQSAIRGISRMLLLVTTSKKIMLTEEQKKKCIETSLDRLIGDANSAPKVYAMHTLAHYAQKREWLKVELQYIINKDFVHQSAAYKAAAREVLRRISQ